MSSEDEEVGCDLPETFDKPDTAPKNQSIVARYRAYRQFIEWNQSNGNHPVSEDVLLVYFEDIAARSKPSTLIAIFAMLKPALRENMNIDITKYSRLSEFVRVKNVGYKSVKSKSFTDEEIYKFVKEAPDDKWLDVKAVCAFAINGASSKLVTVLTDHVKRYDDMILVTLPKTDTTPQCTFPITGVFVDIVQRYADLRPANVPTSRFFLNYHDEKCTTQPIGKHKFNGMARRIANYLKLSEPERYSRYSFSKKTSNLSFNTNLSQNEDADDETSERVELDYQAGHVKTSSFSDPRSLCAPPVSQSTVSNSNSSRNEHVSTFDCEHVKCESEENEDMGCDLPETFDKPDTAPKNQSILARYRTYRKFIEWNQSNGNHPVSEDILLVYFEDIAARSKPSTLIAIFSMLKPTLRENMNIDITKYSRLSEFVRVKNVGYKSVKSKSFTDEEIYKFVKEAPDDKWLDVKAVCAFAINGVSTNLVTVMTDHVKRYDDMILVTLPKTDTTPQCTFPITGVFVDIVQRYADLRPANVPTSRFFLTYHDEQCITKPIGKHKFNGMARRIANYLKLSEPERYSRYSFPKKTSNLSFNTNLNQNEDADDETSERVQLDYQTGHLKTSSFSAPRLLCAPPVSRSTVSNTNSSVNEHVCTLDCGHVKCASEENEKSALHAFNIMKPSEYTVTDLTPALYPTDPTCRWIVAYVHKSGEFTTYNAQESFDEITRKIPYNVRIDQQYIRGPAAQMSEAYIVVYRVNCRCQKDSTDVFDMFISEGKFDV